MFILDDIAMSPVKGFFWLAREIHKAAMQELEGEADRLSQELQDLYRMLESGQLDEATFEEREAEILDRIDALAEMQLPDEDDDDDDDDEGMTSVSVGAFAD